MSDYQQIRVSQFIFSFGPGAIIESKEGSRLIPAFDTGLGKFFQYIKTFELTDTRMTNYISTLLNEEKSVHVFSLPTNAKLNLPERNEVYSTIIFPEWRICYHSPDWRENQKSDDLKNALSPALYNQKMCPKCNEEKYSSQVRFIRACPNGHMDDINWEYEVHKGHSKCSSKWFNWIAKGSSAADIEIVCPLCKASITIADLYKTSFSCNSRLPEKERKKNNSYSSPWFPEQIRDFSGKCNQKMRVVQRRSTSLRVPENITLLKIPEFSTRMARILQKERTMGAIKIIVSLNLHKTNNLQDMKNILSTLYSEDSSVLIAALDEKGIDYIICLYNDIHNPGETFIDLMYKEFESLLSAPGMVDKNSVLIMEREIVVPPTNFLPELWIFPIQKITSITVQTGYHRMVGREDIKPAFQNIGVTSNLGDEQWYPGFEGVGEGIFIIPKEGYLPNLLNYPAFLEWKDTFDSELLKDNQWAEMIKFPGFIWLHTLSHAMIHSLSLFCGYSSASLRERIYLDRHGEKGGILIYNTSPGDDSGMGGLCGINNISLIQQIFEKVIDRLQICSNDPLCHMIRKLPDSKNGAACYSCLLLSETSCEHRNLWLDRHLVIGD
ncbi:DrmB family protein [Methanospirillum sp.]|uniref:DrmB family protein n=1 Tax=Methanospirillum sp. TaxID=45200 RepID=UPI0035A0CF75